MTDELLKALQAIKKECEKQGDNCEKCPMWSGSNDECGVTSEAPYNWRLEKREVYF